MDHQKVGSNLFFIGSMFNVAGNGNIVIALICLEKLKSLQIKGMMKKLLRLKNRLPYIFKNH